jgi:CelD/BcsL family acetyltransferase involved in cellulose biosynthesis
LAALAPSGLPAEAARTACGSDLGRDRGEPIVSLSVHAELPAVEADWRRFEQAADCTPFQTFQWLEAWQRHIGLRNGVTPAIVIGRHADGEIMFLMPLAVAGRRAPKPLRWLGQELCDYNAPLLAADFARCITPARFPTVWRQIRDLLQRDPRLRHDWIELEKMPERVGGQINPFTGLEVALNASGAHQVQLGGDWDTFYTGRRSAATRRRDRIKRKRLSEFGEVRFVTAATEQEAAGNFATLMRQKAQALARMGVRNIFARPGYREFYLELATDPRARGLVHVSRLAVGSAAAAANLGLTFRDCYYHVLASHDGGELSRYGPGAMHLRELLRHATTLGLQRFDFTIGDEAYKQEWSDTAAPLYDHVTDVTWRGWTASRLSIIRHGVKRFVKQTPVLWQSFRHLRALRAGPACFGRLVQRPGRRRASGAARALPLAGHEGQQ